MDVTRGRRKWLHTFCNHFIPLPEQVHVLNYKRKLRNIR